VSLETQALLLIHQAFVFPVFHIIHVKDKSESWTITDDWSSQNFFGNIDTKEEVSVIELCLGIW
jgi:hypothetical protein